MKRGRIWLAFISAFALCVALAACGGGATQEDYTANFAGVWEISGMVSDGEETSAEELAQMQQMGLDVFLVLNEDGTGSFNLFGTDVSLTWSATSATDASIKISDSSGVDDDLTGEQTVMLKDGSLVMESEGSSMTFTKTTQEHMDEVLAGGGLDSLLSTLGSDDTGDDTTTTDGSAAWDTYSDSTYGYSFQAPSGAVAETEEGRISLYWNSPYEMWIKAYTGEPVNASVDEAANRFAEGYSAEIIQTGDDFFVSLCTDSDGDNNYTLMVLGDQALYVLDIYVHPADDTGSVHNDVMTIIDSFGVQL